MRANVLNDKALERYAGRFVWLAVDIENPKNAAFLTKYPIPAVPMLFVIDPAKGSVAIRYVGGATLPQLTKLLDQGERAVHGTSAALADTLIARADRVAASGNNTAAVAVYARAIAAAPKGWAP